MRAVRSRRTKARCSASFANLEFAQGALANPTSGTVALHQVSYW